jgi:hypothetical protein
MPPPPPPRSPPPPPPPPALPCGAAGGNVPNSPGSSEKHIVAYASYYCISMTTADNPENHGDWRCRRC